MLSVGAGGGCLDIFTLVYPFSSLSPSLWETARYRLKYCLKGQLNLKQPTNKILFLFRIFTGYLIRTRLQTSLQISDMISSCSIQITVQEAASMSFLYLLNCQKADDKSFVCKFKKKILSLSYSILGIQRLKGKQCRSR